MFPTSGIAPAEPKGPRGRFAFQGRRMDRARRRTIRISLSQSAKPLPALKDEHCTKAECGSDWGAMIRDALGG